MENRLYYSAIKNTVDYYREKKSEDGFWIVKDNFDKFEVKDIENYYENVDYRKIFWRSYYRRFLDTSPSIDFNGNEINWSRRFVAEIMLSELRRLFKNENKDETVIHKYFGFGDCNNDISDAEYHELLQKHDLL